MKIIITGYENNEINIVETYTEREDSKFDYTSSKSENSEIVTKARLNNDIFMTMLELTQGKARVIEVE